MSNFYNYLASAILAEANKFLTDEQDHLRVMFSGPPMAMLEEVFECMLASGSRIKLHREGISKSVPVLLIQPDASDPSHLNSTRCSGNHVVSIRTSVGSFLVMQAVGDTPLLSTGTTVNKIGLVRGDHDVVADWKQEPFVDSVIKAVLQRYEKLGESAEKLLEKALEEVWEEQGQLHSGPWYLLRKLYDEAYISSSPEHFCALLGVPMLTPSDEPDLGINSRIADFFFENGLNNGTEALQGLASCSDGVVNALADFKSDVLVRFGLVSEFTTSPMLNYAEASNNNKASWWYILTQQKWIELLDPADASDPMGTLAVTCTNELYSQTVKSHPGVVKSGASFRLIPGQNLQGEEVIISRGAGRHKLEILDTIIVDGDEIIWEDTTPSCEHKDYLRYQFTSEQLEKPVSIKLIDLAGYQPGITLNCRSVTKLGQFKVKNRGKKKGYAESNCYECDIVTNGTGTHTLDFYHGPEVSLLATMTSKLELDDDPLVLNIIPTGGDSDHAVCVIEASEECIYTFEARLPGYLEPVVFNINLTASDYVAKGATSEFEKLVIQNCTGSTSSVSKVDARQTLLTTFEYWQLEHADSFLPVILGPGFKENWRVPSWRNKPVLSELEIYLDPRPQYEELTPPAGYLEAREQIREYLFKQCKDEGTLESLSLGQMMLDKNFEVLVTNYILQYAKWFKENPLANWTDLVTVHKAELPGKCLEPRPVAILLSPLHPVRLAWQCNAQDILQSAIRDGQPCPVAGVMDPSSFPDCMALPCRDANGQFHPVGYASVQTTSDYWSVLWKTDAIQESGEANSTGVFGHDLGIDIEGMVRGFSNQQVKRSLDEIRQLAPAKTVLRVSLHSDAKGRSSCNEGIEEWCFDNLGPEQDEWAPAGALSLQLLDKRPLDEQLEPAILASLTERSGTSVRWYSTPVRQDNQARDLSIVDHLLTMNQEFAINSVRSVVDPHCISRIGIKKNAIERKNYLSVSRPGIFASGDDESLLGDVLAQCLALLEGSCPDQGLFDSLSFAPNMATLKEALEDTNYCAISSSAVDASCFHQAGEDTYLWDYELPRYAPGSGQASGFYLVANKSDNMIQATRSVLTSFDEKAIIDDKQITSLLGEISNRGIPTLKRLTGGGTASMGEMGMLIACRLLQGDFQESKQGTGLVPAWDQGRINLVLSADVFQARFDGLRSALNTDSHERPDLLVISILFEEDPGGQKVPVSVKITPIEVKARTGEMDENARKAALGQATTFSSFLTSLSERALGNCAGSNSRESRLWQIANLDLLASWIDYGFRIYGDTPQARINPHWVRYHQDTLSRLMASQLDIQVDPVGRLITIEKANKGRLLTSCDISGIRDTIVLGYQEAIAILAGDQTSVIGEIINGVGNWGLIARKPIVQESIEEAAVELDLPVIPDSLSPVVQIPDSASSVPVLQPSGEVTCLSEVSDESSVFIDDSSAIRFKIGEANDLIGSKEVDFFPGNTELNNINIGVVGDLGTGKTQLLKSLVYQMVRYPENNRGVAPKVLILDYKRDFSDLDDNCQFIKKANVKVVSPYKIPLNLFDRGGDTSNRATLDKIGFFRDILRKIFSVNAPVQDKNLKDAAKAAYRATSEKGGREPTIRDVLEHYEALVDGKPDSVFGIMDEMVDYEIFEDDPAKITSFDKFFDGVVAIDLSELSDEKMKKMVIVIFLNLYFDYMLRVEKKPFLGENPQTRFIDSYLLIDEAHNIMPFEFPVLTKLLVQGRAFGVGVILASQYFSHFKTQKEDYLEPIKSWFIHQVPGITPRDLDKIGLPAASDSMVKRIASLGKFQSLCKTLGYQGEFIDEVPFYRLD